MYDENQLVLFMFIMMRITGFIAFSPIFGRRGIPNLVKAGIIFVFTVVVYSYMPETYIDAPKTAIELMIRLALELGIGYAVSIVVQCFFYVVMQAGSQIDNQMGLNMSENYDPSLGASMTITGTFFNIMMMLLFFVENGHITMLRIFLSSGIVVPYGSSFIGQAASQYIIDTFVSCSMLAVKLALPIVAASLIGQLGMGILMKVIPQINVFAINLELKIILGLVLIMFMIVPISEFLLIAEKQMLVAVEQVIKTISV